ncbi:MAG: DUF1284 domain-containing protein [Oliverpabstia sp.]
MNQLRPHHGMCLAYFRGRGYSKVFVEKMAEIKEKLSCDPLIELTDQTDQICGNCPNNEAGKCKTAKKVADYDRKVLEACGLQTGTQIHWKEFEKLINEKILLVGKREKICGDCQWTEICI